MFAADQVLQARSDRPRMEREKHDDPTNDAETFYHAIPVQAKAVVVMAEFMPELHATQAPHRDFQGATVLNRRSWSLGAGVASLPPVIPSPAICDFVRTNPQNRRSYVCDITDNDGGTDRLHVSRIRSLPASRTPSISAREHVGRHQVPELAAGQDRQVHVQNDTEPQCELPPLSLSKARIIDRPIRRARSCAGTSIRFG